MDTNLGYIKIKVDKFSFCLFVVVVVVVVVYFLFKKEKKKKVLQCL